jgi:hypothetical protein
LSDVLIVKSERSLGNLTPATLPPRAASYLSFVEMLAAGALATCSSSADSFLAAAGQPQPISGEHPVAEIQYLPDSRESAQCCHPAEADSPIHFSEDFHAGNDGSIGEPSMNFRHEPFLGQSQLGRIEFRLGNTGELNSPQMIHFPQHLNFPLA